MNTKVLWTGIIIILVLIGVVAFASMNKSATTDTTGGSTLTTNASDPDGDGDIHDTTATTSETASVDLGANVGVSTGTEKVFTVEGSNFKFSPTTINVKKGDVVKIVFKNTGGFHDFVLPEFNVKTKQGNGPFTEEVTFTASKTGSFEYYCSVGNHRGMGMKGTLTVSE
ncbi:MAG: Blue (Type 1) copper protein [Candidatus Paceibacter sp.]|jgi:plastocyanin|nr:Blue (Type 1) copper protein [Candidatus Paceibacter sp.]